MVNKKNLTEEEKKNKQIDRENAKKCKAVVFPLEKKNDRHLYVYRSMGGWWKMGGHSALFFKYRVAPRLKIKCELRTDRDYYYTFKDGFIPVKNPEALERKLKELRIFKKGVEKEYIVFDLLEVISEDQLKEMRKIGKEQLRQINKIIDPDAILVKTLNMARTVQREVFETCRKLDEPTRQLLGRDMVYVAVRVIDNILCTCKGILKKEKLENMVRNDLVLLSSRVTLLIDEKRIEMNAGIRMLEHLNTLEKFLVEECHKKESTRRVE